MFSDIVLTGATEERVYLMVGKHTIWPSTVRKHSSWNLACLG